jgi:hypothetical protein
LSIDEPTASTVCADLRSMDPVAYITATGLQPEDSYGFLPVEQSEGSALAYAYVYRDRPRYAEVRAGLADPQRSHLLGGMIEVDLPVVVGPGQETAAPAVANAPIASHRVYPRIRTRSSGKQLNHFLPRYAEMLGLHAEDVFGVLPRGTHYFASSTRGWQSMWLIYRDRPEYAQGRERWAGEMAKLGEWPEAEIAPGSGAPPEPASSPARADVRRIGWPKRNLFKRERDEKLGSRLIEEIGKIGYGPEQALGLCPDYDNEKVYLAWAR